MKAQRHVPRTADPQPKEAVAYADLLHMAHDEGLKSIRTQLLAQPNDDNGRLCIVKAIVEVEKGSFEGLGDADPSSVEGFLAPHLIRVAETRAKARALRDAVNCGVVSFEELDGVRLSSSGQSPGSGAAEAPQAGFSSGASRSHAGNGSDGPMTEAQRRYLFRLLAAQGYQGKAAEEFLHAELGVRALNQVTRQQASGLIDQLLAAQPPKGSSGDGAARSQR